MVKTSSGDRSPLAAKRHCRLLQRAAVPFISLQPINLCNNSLAGAYKKILEGLMLIETSNCDKIKEELERIVKAMPEEACSDILSALKERSVL